MSDNMNDNAEDWGGKMGMYDTVQMWCICGNIIEKQSKAGKCSLIVYKIEHTPKDIAFDLQEEIVKCSECGRSFRLDFGLDKNPKYYEGILQYYNESEGWGK